MNSYTVGTLVTLQAAFVNSGGVPSDPSSVTCRVQNPDGSITDLTTSVVRVSAGVYTAAFLTAMYGIHQYEFIGGGVVVAANVNKFFVNETTF